MTEPSIDHASIDPAAFDWPRIECDLDARGGSVLGGLLSPAECEALRARYDEPAPGPTFRSRVVMSRHGFGRGEYKYFAYPLPAIIAQLRESYYPRLVPIANRWQAKMGLSARFPPSHREFVARCHAAGQGRPTPLLLRYAGGDYNCLHQDLYGEQVFPLQMIVLLSRPGIDFDGGELVLTEQRPRMQSVPIVLPLAQGEAAVIAVSQRPKQGARGHYRVNMRHGVAQVREIASTRMAIDGGIGQPQSVRFDLVEAPTKADRAESLESSSGFPSAALRHTAGIIFHDAA